MHPLRHRREHNQTLPQFGSQPDLKIVAQNFRVAYFLSKVGPKTTFFGVLRRLRDLSTNIFGTNETIDKK